MAVTRDCVRWAAILHRMMASLAILFTMLLLVAPVLSDGRTLTDEQVRKALIEKSIASYPGSCPCPYNTAKNGSRCGKRSAWSRAGGYAPLYYPSDITDAMVMRYREEHKGKSGPK
jgi:hypothetical protein